VLLPVTAIVPMVAVPPTVPFTSQTIAVPAGTQKDAVNVCELPTATVAAAGETAFAVAHVTVTLALASFELSATLVAVTLTVDGDGGVAGAV
jgi:hypothetical protein